VPFLIRKIRKRKWDKPEEDEGEAPSVPADPVGDFSTDNNEVSVWLVEENKVNLERVVTALSGAKTTNVSHFDYAIFDSQIVLNLALELKATPGESPDDAANATWHRDIVVGTADNLCALVKNIYNSCAKSRVPAAEVRSNLKKAIQAGQITAERLTEQLKKDLSD